MRSTCPGLLIGQPVASWPENLTPGRMITAQYCLLMYQGHSNQNLILFQIYSGRNKPGRFYLLDSILSSITILFEEEIDIILFLLFRYVLVLVLHIV